MNQLGDLRLVLAIELGQNELVDHVMHEIAPRLHYSIVQMHYSEDTKWLRRWTWVLTHEIAVELISDLEVNTCWLAVTGSVHELQLLSAELRSRLPIRCCEDLLIAAKGLDPQAIYRLALGCTNDQVQAADDIFVRGLRHEDVDVRARAVEALYLRHCTNLLPQAIDALAVETDAGVRAMLRELIHRFENMQ